MFHLTMLNETTFDIKEVIKMFNIRNMDTKKDKEYWLETTFQGYAITYCQEGDKTEKDAREAFETFCKRERELMDPDNPEFSIFIVESEDKEYAGILWMQRRNDFSLYQGTLAWICNIFIEPKFRKQGLATRLMELAESWTTDAGLHLIALHVATSNTSARRLYENRGFSLLKLEGGSCYYQKII